MAGSRYFPDWPNRYTNTALGASTANTSTTLTNLGFTLTNGVWVKNTTSPTANIAAGSYSAINANIRLGAAGAGLGNAGMVVSQASGTVMGVHLYFINCNITIDYTGTDQTNLYPFAFYYGGIAEYRGETSNGSGRIWSNATGTAVPGTPANANSINFINCSITDVTPSTVTAVRWMIATDLIHTNIVNAGQSTRDFVVALTSNGQVYGSTIDGSTGAGTTRIQMSTNSNSTLAFTNANYNRFTTPAPNLVSGITPLNLVSCGFQPTAINSTGLGGTLLNNLQVITGLNQSARTNTGTVVAAGTGMTGIPVISTATDDNQVANRARIAVVSIDPVNKVGSTASGTLATGTVDPPNFWALRANSLLTDSTASYRLIESQTYAPRFFTNAANITNSLLGNVQVNASYGLSYGTPVTNQSTQSTITVPGTPVSASYLSSSTTGRISNSPGTDPFNGASSTALDVNGLRIPYAFYTPVGGGWATDGGFKVNASITTANSTVRARHAAAWVGNSTGASFDTTISRANSINNNTGLPAVADTVSPFRDEAETAFRTAANTSNGTIDTYFSNITAAAFNTQNFGNYVAYRWSLYDTNANPVNYDGSYLNLGSQNVVLDSSILNNSFNTGTQTWNIRSSSLLSSTANGGASTGGVTTTGNINVNSVYNVPRTDYAPLRAASVTYAQNATVLQGVTTTGSAGTPAQWTTVSPVGAGTGTFSLTATLPSGLGAASITANNVSITGNTATDVPVVQAALQSALGSSGVSGVTVSVASAVGTLASFQITIGTGFAANGGSTGSLAFTNTSGTNTIVGVSGIAMGSFATEVTVASNFATALNTANTGNWTATVSGAVITVTASASNTGPKWTGTLGVTATYAPTPFSGIAATITSSTAGVVGGTNMMATFTAATPAVGGVNPTGALSLISSPTTYLTAGTATGLVNSVAGFDGTINFPTNGTIVNTNGTLRGGGSVTATGNITLQGGFTSDYIPTVALPALTFNLSGTQTYTILGANTFNTGIRVTSTSTGLIKLGDSTDTSSSRTTYGADTSGLHGINITHTGPLTMNSGVLAGNLTNQGAIDVRGTVTTVGSGLDATGTAKVLIAGSANIVGTTSTSVNGVITGATTNNGNLTVDCAGTSMTVINLTAANTNTHNFRMTTANAANVMNISNSTIGAGPIGIQPASGTTTLAAVLSGGPVTNTSGTINITSNSAMTGTLSQNSAASLTNLSINGNSRVGALSYTNCSSLTLGDANGAAVLTAGGSVTNVAKNTTYIFGNLDLTGTLAIAQAPAAAVTLSPTITLRSGAVLSIDAGDATGANLTIDCNNISGQTTTSLARSGTWTQGLTTNLIKLLNWRGGTIPAGFEANVTTTVTLTYSNTPTVEPTIKVAEAYKNGGTTNLLTGATRTFANGAHTWTFTSSQADTINGAVFFVDGYQIARGVASSVTTVSATAAPELNVDFGQTLVSPDDTNFIATSYWNLIPGTTAGNTGTLVARMYTTQATNYTTTPTSRTAVSRAKFVMRRILETLNANTVTFRQAIANGAVPADFFLFNADGITLNYVTGTGTAGIGMQMNKTSISNNATITFSIYATDKAGVFYQLNDANTRLSTDARTALFYEGFSPGATANVNTNAINAISSGVVDSLTAATGPLRAVADGVQDASLLVPTTITFVSTGSGGSGGQVDPQPVTPPEPPAPSIPLTWNTNGGSTTYVAADWAGSGGFADWVADAIRKHIRGTASTLLISFSIPPSGIEGWYTAEFNLIAGGTGTYAVFVALDGNIASQSNTFDNTYPIITSEGSL